MQRDTLHQLGWICGYSYIWTADFDSDCTPESPMSWLSEETTEIVTPIPKLTSTGKRLELQQETRNCDRALNPVTHRALGVPSAPIPVSCPNTLLSLNKAPFCGYKRDFEVSPALPSLPTRAIKDVPNFLWWLWEKGENVWKERRCMSSWHRSCHASCCGWAILFFRCVCG